MEIICVGCSKKSALEALVLSRDGVQCPHCNGLVADTKDVLCTMKVMEQMREVLTKDAIAKVPPDPRTVSTALVLLLNTVVAMLDKAMAKEEANTDKARGTRLRPPRNFRER